MVNFEEMFAIDLRRSARCLAREPGFSAAVVLTLALGIGGVCSVWNLAGKILLRPFPYPGGERLVVLGNTFGEFDLNDSSYQDFRDWRERTRSYEELALLMSWDRVNLNAEGSAEREKVEYVSPPYFQMLGVDAARGRVFSESEDGPEGGEAVVLLSDALWRQSFGGDAAAVGQTVRINGQAYEIVGIMPRDFRGLSGEARLWLPFGRLAHTRQPLYLEDRNMRVARVLGRLVPGTSVERASQELDEVARRLAEEYPETNRGYGGRVVSLFEYTYRYLLGYQNIHRTLTGLALGALALLLLVWVNLGHLFTVRSFGRRHAIAVRRALGMRGRAFVRFAVLEAFWLALVGSILGFLLARVFTAWIVATPAVDLPTFLDPEPGWPELAMSLAVAGLSAVLLGGISASQVLKMDLLAALSRAPSGPAGSGRAGWQAPLLITEAAFAMVLVVVAFVVSGSFKTLHETGLGFESERLATFEVALSTPTYDDWRRRIELVEAMRAELQRLPEVGEVGIWAAALPGIGGGYIEVGAEDRPAEREKDVVRGINHHLSPGALSAVGIPLLRGRDVDAVASVEDPVVAVICENLAERLFPGEDPIGERFQAGPGGVGMPIEVVGLVPDVMHGSRLLGREPLDFYLSYYQRPVRNVGFFLLTEGEPAALELAAKQILRRLDPDLPLYGFSTARERMRREEAPERLAASVASAVATTAAFLACLGLYGVLSSWVAQNRRALAVRIAVGARRWQISALVARRGLIPIILGLALGGFVALGVLKVLESVLYSAPPVGEAPYLTAAALLAGAAALVLALPALRAMKTSPATVLKEP